MRPAKDENGNFVRSRHKTINSLVANYVHFLDATVCHYVLTRFSENKLSICTIHDSFYVHPSHKEFLRLTYAQGLPLAFITHYINLILWLEKILVSTPELRKQGVVERVPSVS